MELLSTKMHLDSTAVGKSGGLEETEHILHIKAGVKERGVKVGVILADVLLKSGR